MEQPKKPGDTTEEEENEEDLANQSKEKVEEENDKDESKADLMNQQSGRFDVEGDEKETDKSNQPAEKDDEDEKKSVEVEVKYEQKMDDASSVAATDDTTGSKRVSIEDDKQPEDGKEKDHQWSKKARKFSLKVIPSDMDVGDGKLVSADISQGSKRVSAEISKKSKRVSADTSQNSKRASAEISQKSKRVSAENSQSSKRISADKSSKIQPVDQKSPATSSGSGNDEAEGDDFGQSQALAAKAVEEEIRERRGSWAEDLEDEEEAEEHGDDGGMTDLMDRSKATEQTLADKSAADQQARGRRKRRDSGKGKKDGKDKKKGEKEKVKKKTPLEEKFVEPIYDSSQFTSQPMYTPDSSVTEDILKFYHSYGYDFTRRNNIHMLDSDTLTFINGNYIHFYSLSEQKLKFLRRSAIGNGLGHIAVHPSYKYFAVGEKGENPCIVVFTWPDLNVYRILRRGTTRGYAFLGFNTPGDLMCSQGIEPDYMLTIWDWAKEKIVLRCKAFSQDVFQAMFSPANPGDLTTCGVGHLRFWKMAETFTGLKLQGAIGRFGKTEISDIQGYAAIGGGKIISGCEWGNILVWDGGLIVVELTNAGGKNCHNGEITVMFVQDTPELLTIGMDGYVKLWELDTIEIADTIVSDSGKFEIEPIHELKLSSLAKPVSAIKCLGEPENIWFVQDSWGKIWNVNLTQSISNHEYKANTVFYCPGGGVNAVATSPVYTMMVVGTTMGHLWLMEYINKECIARKSYEQAVTNLIWLSTRYDPTGVTFLAGFNDGNLRVLSVNRRTEKEKEAPGGDLGVGDDEEYKLPFGFTLLDRLRVHKGPMLVMKLDEDSDVLYCCGEDRLIFAISVFWDEDNNTVGLFPLSFVTAPFPVCSLDLHPFKDYRMIIAAKGGRVAECRKPEWGEIDTTISYNQGKLHGRRWFYTSVKSQQRREERRVERKIERDKKYIELLKDIKARKDAGVMVEEDQEIARLNDYYRRAQQMDDDEPLYIPEKPCPILAIYYHINKNIAESTVGRSFFLHVGGYDAGYIYECNCLRPKAAGFHVVPPAPPFKEDVPIHSYIASEDDEFLIFGMGDGTIRVISAYDPEIMEERKNREREAQNQEQSQGSGSEESDSESPPTASETAESNITGSKKTNASKKTPAFQPSIFPYDLEDYMCVSMHDPDRGAVNGLAWSFDYEFLFSVGADGTIFAYRWDPAGNFEDANDDLPSPNLPLEPKSAVSIKDSESPDALTLEELKKKEEDDRIFNAAEEKKEVIRKELRKMKIEYKKIKIANNNIPDKHRLPKECFRLDQRIYEPYREQTRKEVEMVYRKLEYEGAKSIALVEKIHRNFLDEIETPHVIVKDVSHTIQVHTIRNRFMSTDFHDILKQNKAVIIKESTLVNQDDEYKEAEEKTIIPPVKRVFAKELIGEYEDKEYKINTIHAIRNLERRLEKRYKRENKWRELEMQKIPDDYVAPEDVQALQIAKATTGDYKLKTSKDYLGEQISISIRRQRVLDLKLEMYNLVSVFNKNVMDLRNEKYLVIKQCRKKEEQLKRLRKLIPKELRKPIPLIYDVEPAEEPEKNMEITPEQIVERQKKKLMAIGLFEKKDHIMDEMVGAIKPVDFTKKAAPKNKKPEPVARKKGPQRPQGYTQTTRTARSEELDDESKSTHKYRKCVFHPKTIVAQYRYELLVRQRCFEQETLLYELNSMIDYFKNRVKLLRDDRIMLQLDLKLMSLRLMNMIAELQIVKDFETEETGVLERLRAQKVECNAAKDRLEKAKRKLGKAKAEQQKMEDQILGVQKEAGVVIAEKPKHADYLWKVFKKKIRLEVQGEEGEEGEGEDHMISRPGSEQSSESGSTNSTSQDSNSDLFKMPKQKLDVNVCPENLDRDLYSRVCDLREKKTLLEMDVETKKKIVDQIIRDCDEIEKIYNKYEGRLTDIGQEVNIVQRRKQERMNDLMALCVLKADQIQCLDEDEMERGKGSYLQRIRRSFPGHNDLIIFPKNGITKLDLRAEELKDEAANERQRHKKTTHMLMRLQEGLKKMESKVKLLNIKLHEEMLLKFSQVIDLDHVSAAIINLELLDLQLKVEQHRNQQYKEQALVLKALEKEKSVLTNITKENSDCNVLMAKVIERQRDVDYFLYKKNKEKTKTTTQGDYGVKITSSVSTFHSAASSHLANDDVYIEMDRLDNLITKLRERIIYLRATIAAFQKKDGIPEKPILEDMPETKSMLLQVRAIEAKYNAELQYLYQTCGTEGPLKEEVISTVPTTSWSAAREVSSTPRPEYYRHPSHAPTHSHTRSKSEYGTKSVGGSQLLEIFNASQLPELKDQEDMVDVEIEKGIENTKVGGYFLINTLLDDQMPTVEETTVQWNTEPAYDEDPLITEEPEEKEEGTPKPPDEGIQQSSQQPDSDQQDSQTKSEVVEENIDDKKEEHKEEHVII